MREAKSTMLKTLKMVYKILVVVVLFIGVGIQPVFAVTSYTPDNEVDCNLCSKISNKHIVILKSYLKNLKKHDRIKSSIPKYNPKLTMNKRINPENEYPIICSVLFTIIFTILIPYEFISLPIHNTFFNVKGDYPILFFISFLLLVPYVIVLPFFLFLILFNCILY